MDIVGGTYLETCELPYWNAEFGSGGRAAAALSSLTNALNLHTYAPSQRNECTTLLEKLGVKVNVYPASSRIAFAYFHSLSKPHIEPTIEQIVPSQSIKIEGKTVLRFGFIEGDAIVHAQRAIYDPQTSRCPATFQANGSHADDLAIILNEEELHAFTGERVQLTAASQLMKEQLACVIVVKQGAFGATVYEQSGISTRVPAFRTQRVFKIGSGDIFTAGFAYHWGERHIPPAEAAFLASKFAATYCTRPIFPITDSLGTILLPVGTKLQGPILIIGKINTIGRRYLMEEARYQLEGLGADVVCPVLNKNQKFNNPHASTLIVFDGHSLDELKDLLTEEHQSEVVVFAEQDLKEVGNAVSQRTAILSVDFVSALYNVIWAGMS